MTIPTCDKCGKPHVCFDGKHQACAAHKSGQPDTPCSQHPIGGTHLCRNHGGANPKLQAKVARQRADEEARKAVVTLGEPIETDPVDAMRQLVHSSAGHVHWYRKQLEEFRPDALVWGETEVRTSDLQGLTVVEKGELNAWLRLYNEERDRLQRYCATAMKHGLAEREVRVLEQYGQQIGDALVRFTRRLTEEAQLTPAQIQTAVALAPEILRELEASESAL